MNTNRSVYRMYTITDGYRDPIPVEALDQPAVAGGWRRLTPPKTAKRVTHPVPATPKRFRG